MSKINRAVHYVNIESAVEALELDASKHNWKLVRERDNLTHTSVDVKWIEWGENGKAKALLDVPTVGCSLILSPFDQYFTWQTTAVTEILYAELDGSSLRFRTGNSVYTLSKI